MAMSFHLPDARGLTDEVLEALRLRAIRALEKGWNECEVADVFGVARETVCRWWSDFSSGGTEGLPGRRTGRPRGQGRTLDDEQAQHLQQILDSKVPQEVGIAAALWTRRAVRDLIRNEYGIQMPLRTVGHYLARWGYTCKKPRRQAQQQDPALVQAWLTSEYPAIKWRAALEGAQIQWEDETGVLADRHPGKGYARRGQAATLKVPPAHLRINVLATISNEGQARFMTLTKTVTSACFIEFLERLVRGSERKIFLIADQLPAHMAGIVDDWLEAHRDRIEMFSLPAHTPERNVQEYVNQDLKSHVHTAGLPPDKASLREQVQSFLRSLVHLPERIKSYFEHPLTRYAAGELV
jgi:transposase